MSDNAENIGGINVSIGGTAAELEAVLNRIEKRLANFYKTYGNGTVNIGGSVSGGAPRGTAGAPTAAIPANLNQIVSATVTATLNALRSRGGMLDAVDNARPSVRGRRTTGGNAGAIQIIGTPTTAGASGQLRMQPGFRTAAATPWQRQREQEERAAARASRESARQARLHPGFMEDDGIRLGFADTNMAPQRTTRGGGRTLANQTPITAAQRAANTAAIAAQNAQMYHGPIDNAAMGIGSGPADSSRGGAYRRTEEDIATREEQRVAVGMGTAISSPRTGRTLASSFGGIISGGKGGLIEAQAALAASNERVAIAQRRLADPAIYRDLVARRHATEELTTAQTQQAEALKKVESFSTLGAAAKNLASVTIAGAAFGLGLEGINIAMKAAERAASPYFDRLTGYAQMTADLTAALADQARQTQGNAQGVTALKLAQAGFAQSATAVIQPAIAQRAQIEAGNKALQDQIDTYRVAATLQKQSPNAGITSGTGGILGTGLFAIPGTGEQTGNFLQSLNDLPAGAMPGPAGKYGVSQQQKDAMSAARNAIPAAVQQGVSFINGQIQQGGGGANALRTGGTADQVTALANAFHGVSPEMEQAVKELGLFSTQITDTKSALTALNQINIAGTLTGPAEQLAAQKIAQKNAANSVQAMVSAIQYAAPAFRNALVRTAGYSLSTQLPAQAAIANMASPLLAPGIGVKAANAQEQQQIAAGITQSVAAQKQLNDYYAQGQKVLFATYAPQILQNFGLAGIATFARLNTEIMANGAAIAANETAISKETAALATAQYTEQLRVANLSLTDIRQITGQIGRTSGDNLGIYEKENIALGRQAQLLQFQMSQRQINLQVATAGFTVAGLTPAEQAARLTEAKVEAGYAQKQLDIQKQMFGNQVQIVDIGNLRQAVTLANQVNLLMQGRSVTLDVSLRQDTIANLQKLTATEVAQLQTMTATVDSSVAKGISDIQSLEAAAGASISSLLSQAVLASYGVGRAFLLGATGGLLGGGGGVGGGSWGSGNTTPLTSAQDATTHASGFLGNVSGASSMTVGEAGTETVAVLRNPRSAGSGGFGGSPVYFDFSGTSVRSDSDIEMIYRKVMIAMGRDASLRGLRTGF